MDDTHVMLVIVIGLGLTVVVGLGYAVWLGGPKRPDRFRAIEIETGRIVAVFRQWDTLQGGFALIVRLAAEETGPGYPYSISDKAVYRRLQQCEGKWVTVKTGAYPWTGGRWVIEVIE